MARSQSPIVLQPPRIEPVTAAPFADMLQQMGPMMLQFFMQKQQMELQQAQLDMQKEKLNIEKKEAEQKAEIAAGQGQAAQSQLALMAQSNPEIMQAIQQTQPQAGANLQTLGDATQPHSASFDGQFRPQNINPNVALPMAEGFQRFQQQEADIALSRSQGRLAGSQADKLDEETTQLRNMFDTRLAREQAQTALINAQAAGIPREIAVAERNAATAERQQVASERAAAAELAADLRGGFGNMVAALGGDVATASRVAFGADKPPTKDELQDWANQVLQVEAPEGATAEDLERSVEARRRTVFAEGLNIMAPDHNTLDGLLEQAGGDPKAALELLAEMTAGSGDQPLAIGQALAYYSLLFPEQAIRSPIRDSGFLKIMRDALLRNRATVTGALVGAGAGAMAGGGVGSIPGAAVGGILGATGGLGQDILRETSNTTQR